MTGSHVQTEQAWCPDWYAFLQAAKYLNVAPWELAEQSVFWEQIAFMAMDAEGGAMQELKKRQKW